MNPYYIRKNGCFYDGNNSTMTKTILDSNSIKIKKMPQKASSFHASIIQINNESHRIKISIPPIQPKTYSFKDASSLFVHHYFACTNLRTANFILAKKTILFSLLYAALVKIDSNQAKNPNNNNYHVKSIVLASHNNTEAFHSLNDLYDTFYCLSH